MNMESVIRFELQGLSAGLYLVFNNDNSEPKWFVVSTSTEKTLETIGFEHASYLLDGCIKEIQSRIGYRC